MSCLEDCSIDTRMLAYVSNLSLEDGDSTLEGRDVSSKDRNFVSTEKYSSLEEVNSSASGIDASYLEAITGCSSGSIVQINGLPSSKLVR